MTDTVTETATDTAAVIFDMDGVLIDSADAHMIAWRRLGAELGVSFTEDVFRSTFGMHNLQIIPLWLGRELPPQEIDRLSDLKERMFREVAAEHVRPLPGVVDFVNALADDGFSLAVGSSGPKPNVELALGLLGIADRFDALSTGDDVRRGKPDPECFLIAARKLGVDPARCVIVEDAPPGVEAALAAGSKVVAITTTKPADQLTGAHLVVDAFAELTPARMRELLAAR